MSSLLWVVVGAVLLLALALGRRRSQLKAPRVGIDPGILGLNLPAAKSEFHKNGHHLVNQGYHEHKSGNFLVQTPDMQRLIVAPKFLPELRMIPEAKLSHSASLVDRLLGHYNGMDTLIKSRQHSDVCRVQLTQKLSYFVPEMTEELRLAMAGFLKTCSAEKKTPFPTYAFAYTMVLSISSRSFVGLPTSRNPDWLKASAECQAEIWRVASVLRPYPSWLRPVLRPFLAPKGRLAKIMKSAQNIIFPLIDERLQGDGKQLDLLQFLIATSKNLDKGETVLRVLGLMTAALHASTMVTTHALYDMCSMPEYIDDLRAEALAVFQEDGSWELASLKKLRKLDSFLKESMRYNQPDYLGFNRKVLSPIILSDGTVLSTDLYINMAAESLSRDPANYDHPDKFHGYRWFRRWEANKKLAVDEEFTGTEPGNLAWGHGRLTCPGRWYGSSMIKLIIAELLVNYDVAFPEGQTSRPPNVYSSEAIRPDTEQVIYLRKRV